MPVDRIKIAHIVTSLDTGGMENGIINLCNGHRRDTFEPAVYCLSSKGSMAERLKADVEIVDLSIPEGNLMTALYRLTQTYREKKPHIVHTHGIAGGSLPGIVGARLTGVPVVINGEHGTFFLRFHQILIQKFLSALCAINLSVSGALKQKVVHKLGISEDRIWVIPNGVDTNKFHEQYDSAHIISILEKEYGLLLREDSFIIGCVGSLKFEKNQKMLLEALRRMNEKDKAGRNIVLFVGEGPDLSDLQRFVNDSGLSRQVAFLGVRDNVPHWLSAMDVLVSTSISRHEGMSNVILEAMSSGLPVISTKSVGSMEILMHGVNGFLIEPNDIAQLSTYLTLLSSDQSLLAEMSEHAREYVCNAFSLEKMIFEYEKVYKRMLESC